VAAAFVHAASGCHHSTAIAAGSFRPERHQEAPLLACWGFGAANELFEFLSSLRFDEAYVGGLDNAGWDLAFNAFGSMVAALWCTLFGGHGQDTRDPLVRPGIPA
jgi:hypothetical protein